MIKIINLKESIYPDVAVYNLGHEIEIAKKSDINVIIAIHGYGSHGYGGEIRKEIHKNLRLLKSGHQIVDFIKGEQWSENNTVYLPLTELEPELILNNQIGNLNSGVTIVWVKK